MNHQARLAPEYARVNKILLSLPYEGSDWQPILKDVLACYRAIASAILSADESVQLIVLAKDKSLATSWAGGLLLTPQQEARMLVVTDIDYNDTWVRDYGPLTFKHEGGVAYRSFTFNGWGNKYPAHLDNQVATALQHTLNCVINKYDLVLEGGALEINGDGVLLVNRDCIVDINRNRALNDAMIEQQLFELLGAQSIEWLSHVSLTGDDTDGHVDTIARFVRDDTVVACGIDASHPDADSLQSLNKQLQKICNKRGWRLISLPMPKVYSALDRRLLPATYANFLLCNGKLFLPVYDVPEDEVALNFLQNELPEYQLVPVNCTALVEQHGSLHCATMQLG